MNRVLHRLLQQLCKNDIMRYASTLNDSYNDALTVYNQLSNKDRQYISPSGKYIDSPYLISRKIKYINNQPVGFCDAYKFNGVSNVKAFLIIAVLEEYRGYNIASELLNQTINDCINQGYYYFIYKCDISNKSSKKLAIKNHFSLTNKTKNQLTFTLQVNPNLINNTSSLDNVNQSLFNMPKYNYPYYSYNYPLYPHYYGYLPYSAYANYINNQQNINQDNLSDMDESSNFDESNIDNSISDIGGDVSGDSGE